MPDIPNYIGLIEYNHQILGTGFIAHQTGIVVTCYHVLAAKNPIPAGQSFVFIRLVDQKRINSICTNHLNPEQDIGLLRLIESLGPDQHVAPLIATGELLPSTPFSLSGYGVLQDQGHQYGYFSATGEIVGPMERNQVSLLQLRCDNLLPGMSGAPIVTEHGVVGVLSGRYSINPNTCTWMEHMGYAARTEVLPELHADLQLMRFLDVNLDHQEKTIINNSGEFFYDHARKIEAETYIENQSLKDE